MKIVGFDIEISNVFDLRPGEDIDKYAPFDLAPKQAYDDWHLHNGAGRRLMARTVPPAVCDGCGALGCPLSCKSRTGWGPVRAGTSIPRHHEANSTPQRPIHLPAYGVDAA